MPPTAQSRTVYVDSQPVTLTPADMLGAGGFALVFKGRVHQQDLALKILKKPDPQMARKIEYLVRNTQQWAKLGSGTFVPLHVIRDGLKGNVLGFTMRLLPPDHMAVSNLFNRGKAANLGMHTQKKAQLYTKATLSLDEIHAQRLRVVDLSPFNLEFTTLPEDLWIDFDSWRHVGQDFGEKLMYTADFVDPLLVPPDGTNAQAKYKEPSPDNDRFSLHRIFFRVILGYDPYGGTHPTLYSLEDRVASRAYALEKNVTLPVFGSKPEVLSDDLLHAYRLMFVKDQRDSVTSKMVEQYAASLVECTCGAWYPRNRKSCPECSAQVNVAKPLPAELEMKVKELLDVGNRTIEFVRFYNGHMIAVSNDRRSFYVSVRGKTGQATTVALFKWEAKVRFELVDEKTLAVNRNRSSEIELWSLVGQPALITKTTSRVFNGNGLTVFRGSNGHLLRIARTSLMGGTIQFGDQLVETILPIGMSENQSWVWSDQISDTHLALRQFFERQMYSLVRNGLHLEDIEVTNLRPQESQNEVAVRFGASSLMIRRLTIEKPYSYLRTDILDYTGKLVHSSRVRTTKHQVPNVRGAAYADANQVYAVFHPTDEGVIKEVLNPVVNTLDGLESDFTKIAATKGVISEDFRLIHLNGAKHFLANSPSRVLYLIIE